MELFKMIVKSKPPLDHPCFSQPVVNDLMHALLQKSPKKRITIPEIGQSVFFKGFNWGGLHARRMTPPWVPPPNSRLPPGVGTRSS